LLEALERHLPGSREHADGSASYAFAAAAELRVGRLRAELAREAARLHEIGLVYIPVELLGRPREELSPQEAALVDSHPTYGAQLARGAAIPDEVCEWIAAAGTRFEGGAEGEPGAWIPVEARVIRAACVCASLLAEPATPGAPRAPEAIAELRGERGRDLDPHVVEVVVAILDRAASATGRPGDRA
jgi:HD-GYP domain-containing protein (c-di-GMP phosphodiesterase class II)